MRKIKSYSQYIKEAMKTAKDLNPNIGLFIHDYSLTLYDIKENKVYAYVGLSQNDNGTYYFPSIAAEPGFGPLILKYALMYVHTQGESLMVSRDGDIRGEAFNVWKKFYYNNDIIKDTLDFNDNLYNFAIITGEEDFEDDMSKLSEYEFHVEDGFEEDIKIYNTKMSMKPSDDFNELKNRFEEKNLDLDKISSQGNDFFSVRYND